MVEKAYINSKDLFQKLEDIMKCEICKSKYDYDTHRPLVVKCGHTFCKKCIIEKNALNKQSNKYDACPLDSMQNIFDIETCIINLRVEFLLKKIFNITSLSNTAQPPQQQINQKQIV